MIIKHVTNQGRELGSYQSISTASKHLGKDIFLLSVAIRNRVPLDDGSYILRVRPKQADAKLKKNAIVQMLREYIKLDTPPRLLARKYDLDLKEVCRLISKHNKEKAIHSAYMEWYKTQRPVSEIAAKYDISGWSLSARIKKGFRKV